MKRKDISTEALIIVKQTLGLMLNNKKFFDKGLCLWLINTWYGTALGRGDRDIVFRYIKDNRPFSTTIRYSLTAFWWKKDTIVPRIKWIKKHISLIEKELINRKRPI